LLEWYFQGDLLELHIKWRETPIKVKAYIYLCEKSCKTLNEELDVRGIESTLPQTIIPESSISGIHQVVQGILHYTIYTSKQRRIKNKGLLLATMIIGISQLSELTQKLAEFFQTSYYYYLIGVEHRPINLYKCSTLKPEDFLKKPSSMSNLVKNTNIVLSLF